ncbi:hypothetical protein POM88_034269 [Heracleum sosnowskyi]|uniref:Uncharacterized protein n=1 Tax=Heracleum sosnowskyi TaxID=360622 RepID=A0AAD8MCT9_9APIA|nr:hypothetical protein POM88_034269 [Heracleum sosnowskyi]
MKDTENKVIMHDRKQQDRRLLLLQIDSELGNRSLQVPAICNQATKLPSEGHAQSPSTSSARLQVKASFSQNPPCSYHPQLSSKLTLLLSPPPKTPVNIAMTP